MNRRDIVLAALMVTVFVACASAGELIYGFAPGTAYVVDPYTGVATPVGSAPFVVGASSGPTVGSVFLFSGINLYLDNVLTGTSQPLGGLVETRWDLAFDPSAGALYGVGAGIYSIDGCLDFCSETLIGSFPGVVQAIDYVPGYGLFGADLDGILWRFNPSNGDLEFVGITGISNISDMAFDYSSRQLIASAAGPKLCGDNCPPFGSIWSIDPNNGSSVLLNDNAPIIWGMAEVTPEPASIAMMVSGLSVMATVARVRRRARKRGL